MSILKRNIRIPQNRDLNTKNGVWNPAKAGIGKSKHLDYNRQQYGIETPQKCGL